MSGIFGRFKERLKRIAFYKRNKNKNLKIQDSEDIYKNFLKVVAAIPSVVYGNTVNDSSMVNVVKENNIDVNDSSLKILTNDTKESSSIVNKDDKKNDISFNKSVVENRQLNDIDKKKKIDLVNKIDVSLIKKKQEEYYNNNDFKYDKNIKETENNDIEDVRQLEKKIINLIKKNLIKTVNELEILQSELYIISEVNGEEKTLKECQKTLDEVKKMLCKIDILKKKYDFLKDNYDFEYLLEIGDDELIDNIIELKNKFSNNEVRATVTDYKLLDVYKFLYLRIDKLEEQTIQYEEEKEDKLQELKDRDIDFEKLKEDVFSVSRANESYEKFVEDQKNYLNELNQKVSKINSFEVVSYKLKGFSRFLLNSFKYVGLLMLNPLKGIVPSIATETLVTRNVVSNLYNNLEWQESKRMVYEAIDYSSEIRNAISDLSHTGRIVDATLEDIVKLKIKYNEQFKKYQGDFLEYEEVIGKINDMENKIVGNKIKIELMRKKMLDKENENSKKLKLVNDLNSSSV